MNRRIDKRTYITEHVYTADGRKKEPHPNPLPRRGNSIISSHLPLGEIREGYSTIQQNTNYYPYGGMTSISTGQGEQQFKYNGKEYDPMHGLNEYDYGARQYDPARGQFTTMDPLCEKYYHISPYAYCGGNPLNRVDVDGTHIEVMPYGTFDNMYIISGGCVDDDLGIYAYYGKNNQKRIGDMLTQYSFFYDSGVPVLGAIIDMTDLSGQEFLNNFFLDTPILLYYMPNATEFGKYDFKNKGLSKHVVNNLSKNEVELHRHRGMEVLVGGNRVIASARDIGNFAAGYIAGTNMIPESVARPFLNALETWQHINGGERIGWYEENNPSKLAQREGNKHGINVLKKTMMKVLRQIGTIPYIPIY